MKLLTSILSLLLFLNHSLKAQDKIIPVDNILDATFFQGTYQEVLLEAKKLRKPILLTFSASWCQPCQKLEAESFSAPEVASLLSLRYVSKIVDVEQFVGMDVADVYKVSEYPITIILDEKGRELERLKGFFPPDYLIKTLLKYKKTSSK